MIWWMVLACGDGRPAPVTGVSGPVYALSVNVPFAELRVPPDSREGRAPPVEIPIVGEWEALGAGPTGLTWRHALPIRPRALFFYRPPEGMSLVAPDGPLPYKQSRRGAWTMDAANVTLALPPHAPPPAPMTYSVVYAKATEREAALNQQFSGKAPEDFVRARVQAGPTSRGGLLLPAPGLAAWQITLPPAAELSFAPGLVAPETVDAPDSDGATFVVEIEVGGVVTPVWSATLSTPAFTPVRVDLSRWAGQSVRLRFRTEPGATSRFDYAFFADPIVAPRHTDAKRVVLVFIDTLRADHVGTYGYARDTTPRIDAFASTATTFERARSVAPWTLPSTRGVLAGRQPEAWGDAPTLQGRAREAGWQTAMFAGNVYLSANFDMERDWGLHDVVNWPQADDQVDKALAWLDGADGHDAMVLVHLMDAHLPYDEPEPFASKFSGDRPEKLRVGFERAAVISAGRDPAARRYVEDRYDNSIAYADHELGRLFDKLRPDDVVVVFADHGEEFWDHNGFEHGHTLREELLHVPLIVRAPGLAPGRVKAPVSLLDVAPTVAALAGWPAVPSDGADLTAASAGDAAALAALAARPLAFGRPLYGSERWGAVLDTSKYTTTEGREQRWDLATDPTETKNALDPWDAAAAAEGRGWLAAGLGRDVHVGWRIAANAAGKGGKADVVAVLTVPGGVAFAVAGDDPTEKSDVRVSTDGDRVEIRWKAGYRAGGEAFVVPLAPLGTTTPTFSVGLDGEAPLVVTLEGAPAPDGQAGPLAKALVGGRTVSLGFGVVPTPSDGAKLSATNAEAMDTLRAIGYAVGPNGDTDGDPR